MLRADCLVNIAEENLRDVVMELTDGLGADLVVETSGAAMAIVESMYLIRRHGKICAIGISGKSSVDIPLDVGIFKDAEIRFSFSHRYLSWETALKLMATSAVNARSLITHRVGIDDWKAAF